MLNEEQIQKVRLTLSSSGWIDVIVPAVLNRGKQALDALTLSEGERQKAGGEFKDTDDMLLRAIIRDCQWVVAAFQNEVKIFDYNKRQEELQSQENGALTPS